MRINFQKGPGSSTRAFLLYKFIGNNYVCVMIRKLIYVIFLLSSGLIACNTPKPESNPGKTPTSADTVVVSKEADPSKVSVNEESPVFQIIPAAEGTWGYMVEVNGQKILQTTIPGLPGKLGFKKREDAEATAALVWYKMKAGMFPPLVTQFELDSMKISK